MPGFGVTYTALVYGVYMEYLHADKHLLRVFGIPKPYGGLQQSDRYLARLSVG